MVIKLKLYGIGTICIAIVLIPNMDCLEHNESSLNFSSVMGPSHYFMGGSAHIRLVRLKEDGVRSW